MATNRRRHRKLHHMQNGPATRTQRVYYMSGKGLLQFWLRGGCTKKGRRLTSNPNVVVQLVRIYGCLKRANAGQDSTQLHSRVYSYTICMSCHHRTASCCILKRPKPAIGVPGAPGVNDYSRNTVFPRLRPRKRQNVPPVRICSPCQNHQGSLQRLQHV